MTETLPLFPLSSVLLPTATLPLHIFEARYRELVSDLVNEVVPNRRFGIVGIRQGWEVGEENIDAMYDIGCAAVLQEVRQLPEARYDLTAIGEQRFRLLQIDREAAPYLMARVEWLPDDESEPGSPERLMTSARTAHAEYHASGLRNDSYEPPEADLGVGELSYALAEDCVLSTEDKQSTLAETDPVKRLRLVRNLLLRETEFLRELRAVPASLAEFAEQTSVN